MNLMEQCQLWNENDEYQKIIDAIQALPETTPELDSELARAYNNLAEAGDRALFQKAIELLKPHEAYFAGEHNWNFRIAYAYYYLDQEGPALRYFERALEARPGDEDTQAFINDCRKRLALPRFAKNFRQRTAESWAAFTAAEGELRRLMDLKNQDGVAEKLVGKCKEALSAALEDVAFELGFNGKKYELILTPEGDRSRLFELVYFQRHAPAPLLERWNILVGRQPSRGFGLRSFGLDISAQDVRVWAERGDGSGRSTVSLTLYCEKLLPLLREEEGKVWWMLSNLTDQALGEIPAMSLIEGFEVTDKPRAEPGVSLDELPQMLERMGLKWSLNPEAYLDNGYTAYEMEPEQDPDADWRLDVITGVTRCPALINEYLRGESEVMDALHKDGAAAGFFCYPLDCFNKVEERGKAVLDFRDAVEEAVLARAGTDAVTFLGGATGIYCGYLDFIAWDLPAVLDAAADFFRQSPLAWANFHVFRRQASTIRLMDREEEPETPVGPEEENREETGSAGSFVGFVLLSETGWDKDKLIRDLKTEWDLDAGAEEDENTDALVFSVEDMMAAVSLMPAPVPDGEAERNAASNYMWPAAVDAARAHKAHLMVAVLGQDADLLERGKLFVKLVACCCKQENAAGVYTSGTVFEPRLYEAFADMMKEGELPIFNWVWLGLYRRESGVCCYTYGMELFGREEMEVLDAEAQPSEVRDFLSSLVAYVLESGVVLRDGETIGFSAQDKHTITRGAGVSLPGMTLKIRYDGAAEEG